MSAVCFKDAEFIKHELVLNELVWKINGLIVSTCLTGICPSFENACLTRPFPCPDVIAAW